ncbi:uncharacterized protein IL334_005218 [Kwoniella shivajii]|uniref:LsmAD domain-containing protein n=1 Tax=Kwoniella shivajii TaxID=564305 RepID=A0ABZ1D2J4_9TREE|nr:hypothetical protein IL334_005218 [Kwoniella shivajii]
MSTIERGGGRGGGGARGGIRGGRGGADSPRGRGVWRGGPPPGSNSYPVSRGTSPAIPGSVTGTGAGTGTGTSGGSSPAPRQSINDHMNDMKKIVHDDKNRSNKGFQTDTDISKSSGPIERELKPWVPDSTSPPSKNNNNGSNGNQVNGSVRDVDTFGTLTANIPWDQFETNEKLFGVKTNYQEELYTTKLNKNTADFKKREKEAERLANEIMGTTSKNTHIQEERGQAAEDSAKDEEEKYSGVVRAPGAYVPPGARKALGGPTPAPAPRVSVPPAPAATASIPNGNVVSSPAPQPIKAPSPAPESNANMAPPPAPARSTSDDPSATVPAPAPVVTAIQPAEAPAAAPAVTTITAAGGVVDQWRQFVGTEREKAEAKKQSHMKTEREKQLADLKKFHANFKVPLPMPKDILPILAKDENKQKDIEAKAANQLEKAREDRKAQVTNNKSPTKASAPMESAGSNEQSKPLPPKKPFMRISEIPPFNPAKKKPVTQAQAQVQAPVITIPETANQNIPQQATSPTPSMASLASGSQAKLNPKANTFVFKPSAAVFKPGQPSGSPATAPRQTPAVTSSVPSPALAAPTLKNPFFQHKLPEKVTVDIRSDFNPWKHGNGSVPSASSIGLQWPYPGRKSHIPSFAGGPMGVNVSGGPGPMHLGGPGTSIFDDETTAVGSPSPHPPPPQILGGMQPYPGYGYRFNQPGLPPHMPSQMSSPMFSPGGPQFAPLPGQQMGQQPPHQLGGPQPNGMPMYYQPGMPQNPQFLPPQHMQINPHTAQRHGPGPGPGMGQNGHIGPGGPGSGPQGYYSPHHGVSTPQQTPQMVQHNLPPYPQQPQQQYHPHSPMQPQGGQGGGGPQPPGSNGGG